MSLTRLELKNFTAFKELKLDFSPGINVFIGENGTGKTHLLKVLYSACDITGGKSKFADKITEVFLPSYRHIGRLVNRQRGKLTSSVKVLREKKVLAMSFHNQMTKPASANVINYREWISEENEVEAVYIPVKEMLANAPGFRSEMAYRKLHFEEVYSDIIDKALLPILRGPMDSDRARLIKILQQAMQGTVATKEEEFILRTKGGHFEFTLLAEGIRKLGLLYRLIQNGSLSPGSILFWDEPEANLNPKMMQTIIGLLLELRRMGVQVFLATHSYNVLKELDLQGLYKDEILFHALFQDNESGEIKYRSTGEFLHIEPNAILAAFDDIYDREIKKSLGGK